VAAKVKAEDHVKPLEQSFLAAIRSAKTTDDVHHVEAEAAQVWWQQWAGVELAFKEHPAAPAAWHTFHSRYIGRPRGKLGESAKFTTRGAVHPCQAMLNFTTAIVTARLARAILAKGLDPCFGFLHDGRKPGRMSLVWDAVEPLRPSVTRAVFGYVETHEFEKKDFLVFIHKITGERTIRLAPPLAKEIALLAVRAVSVRERVKTADWLMRLF
jgi:CRISPR/Cas system-associated endonuclease Cas1